MFVVSFSRYVLPLSVTAYLFVKMSRELQQAEGPLPVMVYDGVRARTSTGSHDFRFVTTFVKMSTRTVKNPQV